MEARVVGNSDQSRGEGAGSCPWRAVGRGRRQLGTRPASRLCLPRVGEALRGGGRRRVLGWRDSCEPARPGAAAPAFRPVTPDVALRGVSRCSPASQLGRWKSCCRLKALPESHAGGPANPLPASSFGCSSSPEQILWKC